MAARLSRGGERLRVFEPRSAIRDRSTRAPIGSRDSSLGPRVVRHCRALDAAGNRLASDAHRPARLSLRRWFRPRTLRRGAPRLRLSPHTRFCSCSTRSSLPLLCCTPSHSPASGIACSLTFSERSPSSCPTFLTRRSRSSFSLGVGQLYRPATGFTTLILFGGQFEGNALPAVRAVPHHIEAGAGYDGQFYAQLALDPLLRSEAITTAIDNAGIPRTAHPAAVDGVRAGPRAALVRVAGVCAVERDLLAAPRCRAPPVAACPIHLRHARMDGRHARRGTPCVDAPLAGRRPEHAPVGTGGPRGRRQQVRNGHRNPGRVGTRARNQPDRRRGSGVPKRRRQPR